ncbi:hypothetical protein JTE90_010783 [Oedothorax gibbosus]|uniref:Uncharacterized protein n=1 Tax=Oedothorax gibbosus TaxID=931172 RepID=A0AAV6VHC6_9ARAC|nr:hypothetical protein JTE90_010783 [Oedothorax gibbosus]
MNIEKCDNNLTQFKPSRECSNGREGARWHILSLSPPKVDTPDRTGRHHVTARGGGQTDTALDTAASALYSGIGTRIHRKPNRPLPPGTSPLCMKKKNKTLLPENTPPPLYYRLPEFTGPDRSSLFCVCVLFVPTRKG